MAKPTTKKGSSPKAMKKANQPKPKAIAPKIAAKSAPAIKVKAKKLPEPVRVRRAVVEPPVEIPQAAAVPTNGRPRKNLAGFTPRELELFRDQLLAKRREIVGDMSSMEREALRSSSGSNLSNLPLHMADMGTDNYEQEFTLGLMEKDRKLLRDLNDGLAKIQNGTFGICEGTGRPISRARLEAQPWARYSIEYARKLERRLGG
ncbi:MAG TPA: TraR/DksA C4-type zinc finger protein [Tepidisphaeraceae bacterium]|nr:TraR/DksA C4-type zinc finger protein [Tepidisphaeraceae bacterium]